MRWVRGDPLSGTSYAWKLLNHVAKDSAVQRMRIDFKQISTRTPMEVVEMLALDMGLTASPRRTDNPSQEQLAGYLVRWLSGQLRNSDKTWWIVFDNAQQLTVPPETKEMIVAFVRHFASGALDDVRLFVLGFDIEIGCVGPPDAIDFALNAIGRPEIIDFLTEANQRFGDFPTGLADADTAADYILSGRDLANPTREVLSDVSNELNQIVEGMRR
ncbi:MAG: hypothetical protein ABJQ71_22695 [Roseibium sp.]